MQRALMFLLVALGASPCAASVASQHPDDPPAQINASADEGIRFSCHPSRLNAIEAGMSAYLSRLKVAPSLVVKKTDRANGIAVYTLNTPKSDTSTLDFKSRPELHVRETIVFLPSKNGKERKVVTVSKKEILLALLQHGRLTEFKGDACDVQALKEHIGIRQNIAAWAEDLNWVWPDGSPAKWNEKYWDDGTPWPGYPLHEALDDVFLNQDKYSIGCYTSGKLLMVQGVLDYFRRIKKDRVQQKRVEQRLLADHEPLRHIEPGRMWDFEKDFDPQELPRPGKLLKIEYRIAPKNFVPGDWVHLLNTDPVSYRKTGYEGSNPIYLGRNKFADYFNDHHHSYTFRQKLDEVYQWRNGVFSRLRDAEKIKPLTPEDVERLSRPPSEGGLLTDMRVFPYFFGYEDLPELAAGPASE
ncbi:MAG TPA: hypothetical protein VFP33_00490 [Gallionella sp.]|nr:hypothetical protein [Gallionella sp.]